MIQNTEARLLEMGCLFRRLGEIVRPGTGQPCEAVATSCDETATDGHGDGTLV